MKLKHLLYLSVLLASLALAEGPVFQHKDPVNQQEFENVYKDLRSTSGRYVQNTDSLQSGATFYVSSGTASAFNATTINASSKIGIGTTSPGQALHISGSNDTAAKVETTGSGKASFVQFTNLSGVTHEIGMETQTDAGGGRYTGPANSFNISAGSTYPVVVSVNGNECFRGQGNQLRLNTGSAGTPSLAFTNESGNDTGFYFTGNNGQFAVTNNGAITWSFDAAGKFSHQGGDGVFYAGVGSAGSPTVSFDDDPDTGMFHNTTNQIGFSANGSLAMAVTNVGIYETGGTFPGAAGTYNLGDATFYWNDVSYKTLTDRGCLGWFDNGVDFNDGTHTNDLASWAHIKFHPTKKTVYGAPMLDYRTFPKVAYKRADYDIFSSTGGKVGKAEYPRDANDDPFYYEVATSTDGISNKYMALTDVPAKDRARAVKKYPQDGIEMTSVFSIMIGSFKEANARIEALEARVAALQAQVEKLNGK